MCILLKLFFFWTYSDIVYHFHLNSHPTTKNEGVSSTFPDSEIRLALFGKKNYNSVLYYSYRHHNPGFPALQDGSASRPFDKNDLQSRFTDDFKLIKKTTCKVVLLTNTGSR